MMTLSTRNVLGACDLPYAGGDLCRSIRKRFNDELISYLLELKWWDWVEEKIFHNLEALCSEDLEQIRHIS